MLFREVIETVYGKQLVICNEEADTDGFERSMMIGNEIPGLLSATIQDRDGRECYIYDLSGRQSLMDFYGKREISFEELERIFAAHKRLYQSISEFLLDPSGLLLSPENIFVDIHKGELSFVYVPGYSVNFAAELRGLWEYLLWRIDHKDTEAVQASYRFYSNLVQGDFSVDEFLEIPSAPAEGAPAAADGRRAGDLNPDEGYCGDTRIEKEEGGVRGSPPVYSARPAILICGTGLILIITCVIIICFLGPEELAELMYEKWSLAVTAAIGSILMLIPILAMNREYKEKRLREYAENKSASKNRKADDTGLYYRKAEHTGPDGRRLNKGGAETGYENGVNRADENGMRKYREPFFSVCKDGSGRDLVIRRVPAVIGKSREADLLIDKRAVSRRHAEISREADGYYITDLDSTNGTSVNGHRLTPGELFPLRSRDEVRFADSIYYFFCDHTPEGS